MKASALIFILTLSILPVLAIPLQKEDNPQRIAQAIKKNNIDFLQKYITEKNVNDCYTLGNSEYNALAMSITLNAVKSFELLIKQADLESNCTGKTAMMYAVKYGQLQMVKKLIESGANINTTSQGKSAMAYAKKYDQQEILEYLQTLHP